MLSHVDPECVPLFANVAQREKKGGGVNIAHPQGGKKRVGGGRVAPGRTHLCTLLATTLLLCIGVQRLVDVRVQLLDLSRCPVPIPFFMSVLSQYYFF